MIELFSTVDVARRLGVAEHRVRYAIRSGHIPPARWVVAGKAIFSEHDVRRIGQFFGVAAKGERL